MRALSHALQTRWYWISLFMAGVALLAVALYYQYVLGDEPCQVCIHARLWVAAFTLIALFMAAAPQKIALRIAGNAGVLVASVGLTERARYLPPGKRHRRRQLPVSTWDARLVCRRSMDAAIRGPQLCSFTLEMLFGLSMAEILVGVGAGICVLAGWVMIRDVAGYLGGHPA